MEVCESCLSSLFSGLYDAWCICIIIHFGSGVTVSLWPCWPSSLSPPLQKISPWEGFSIGSILVGYPLPCESKVKCVFGLCLLVDSWLPVGLRFGIMHLYMILVWLYHRQDGMCFPSAICWSFIALYWIKVLMLCIVPCLLLDIWVTYNSWAQHSWQGLQSYHFHSFNAWLVWGKGDYLCSVLPVG